MCGIAGFYGAFSRSLLQEMTARIAHRGPDDLGLYTSEDGAVGLGHRRLSIIDLAPTGHQPMVSRDGSCTIVYNGEIYNYRELRRELEADGAILRGQSDTEVLLELYARHGIECLKRLNGIFALAVWEPRTRSLTIVRDGQGIKPLYYAQTPAGLLFASELKAVLCSPDVARDYDTDALAHYLTYMWAPAPETPLKSVRKLEPGEWIRVQDGRIAKRGTFYQLPAPAPISESPEQSAERLATGLTEAVKRQLIADVPVGAFLSGGLDSSSIVALARKVSPNPLPCFTIAVGGGEDSDDGMTADLPFARRVAQHLGVPLHEVSVDASMAQDLEWMVGQLDEPQADPACLNTFYICRLARQRGFKVLLSGAGGDDLFTGYRRHTALLAENLWSWLPRVARRGLAKGAAGMNGSGSLGRRVAKALRYADADPLERLVSYFYWTPPEITAALMGRGSLDVGAPLKSALAARPDIRAPLDQMLFLEGRFFLADHNLAYTDKMSMATGVEVRVPLIDREIVSLASTIPLAYKQRGREGKWILKRAMEPYLPKDVIYRPKTGFGVPLRAWLAGPLRKQMDELLRPESLDEMGLFDPRAVSELRRKTESREIDGGYTLLSLMCMVLWHRQYARPAAAAPLPTERPSLRSSA